MASELAHTTTFVNADLGLVVHSTFLPWRVLGTDYGSPTHRRLSEMTAEIAGLPGVPLELPVGGVDSVFANTRNYVATLVGCAQSGTEHAWDYAELTAPERALVDEICGLEVTVVEGSPLRAVAFAAAIAAGIGLGPASHPLTPEVDKRPGPYHYVACTIDDFTVPTSSGSPRSGPADPGEAAGQVPGEGTDRGPLGREIDGAIGLTVMAGGLLLAEVKKDAAKTAWAWIKGLFRRNTPDDAVAFAEAEALVDVGERSGRFSAEVAAELRVDLWRQRVHRTAFGTSPRPMD